MKVEKLGKSARMVKVQSVFYEKENLGEEFVIVDARK